MISYDSIANINDAAKATGTGNRDGLGRDDVGGVAVWRCGLGRVLLRAARELGDAPNNRPRAGQCWSAASTRSTAANPDTKQQLDDVVVRP